MANKKVPVRQKMINLMYLVLTALLAMQVSNGVLEKFILIDDSFGEMIKHQEITNRYVIERIKKIIEDSGNRQQDLRILEKALKIKKNTKIVLERIKKIRNELIERTGGRKADGRIKGLNDENEVANFMLNEGKGLRLKNMLNKYSAKLSQEIGKEYPFIALDAKHSALFKNDPNQKDKTFEELYFDHTPLASVMAILNQLSSKVIYMAGDALEKLAHRIGDEDVKFDKFSLEVCPESRIVAAGTKYKANMFFTASSSGISDPKMQVNGRSIPVKDGLGEVILNTSVSDSAYNKEGLAKKSYEAIIRIKKPTGKEEVLKKRIEYFVAKPVIQIQSDAIQVLYLNCANQLNIQVPTLGRDYRPRITAIGAKVIPGKVPGSVTVVPFERLVKLHVYQGNNLLGIRDFKARPIPHPTILITSRGRRVNAKNGFPAPGPRSLKVVVKPDPTFKRFLPNDARYRVKKWEVSLLRGKRQLASKIAQGNSSEIDLGDFVSRAKPGDRIYVEVKQIERLNFKKEIETVNMGIITETIHLTS